MWAALGDQLRMLKAQILEFDRMIRAWHRSSETSRRLDDIPGVGPVLATALVAGVADPRAFRSGRDFSAWIGLVPKQSSSGGKDRLGNISKPGDREAEHIYGRPHPVRDYLRSLAFDCLQSSIRSHRTLMGFAELRPNI